MHAWIPMTIACLVAAIIIAKHHQNIGRLLSGTEYRFGAKKPRPEVAQ
jgi:glycerol-3-phosphate acyltransferase PlsY